jgi:hypothetical protein
MSVMMPAVGLNGKYCFVLLTVSPLFELFVCRSVTFVASFAANYSTYFDFMPHFKLPAATKIFFPSSWCNDAKIHYQVF